MTLVIWKHPIAFGARLISCVFHCFVVCAPSMDTEINKRLTSGRATGIAVIWPMFRQKCRLMLSCVDSTPVAHG